MKSSCIIAWRIYDYANVLVLTPVLVDQNLKYGILLCIITNVPGLMCCHSFILDQVFALMRLISVLIVRSAWVGHSQFCFRACLVLEYLYYLSCLIDGHILIRISQYHFSGSLSFSRYAYVKAQQAVSVCVMCLLRFVTVWDALINITVLFK